MKKIIPLSILIGFILADVDASSKIKGGLGIGTGFGMIGGGIEFETFNTALLAGIGTFGVDNVSWDLSLRYYLRSSEKKMRPWITFSYAPTHTIKYESQILNLDNEEIIFGYHGLVGFDHDFGGIDGFIMTYGLGFGFPGDYSDEVKNDYEESGLELPELERVISFSIAMKYSFSI